MEEKKMLSKSRNSLSRRGLLAGLAVGGASAAVTTAAGTAKAQATNTGPVAWKQPGNNHHVLDLQAGQTMASEGEVQIEYWGHCAFKITTPRGLTLLFDPWRNDPSGYWGV